MGAHPRDAGSGRDAHRIHTKLINQPHGRPHSQVPTRRVLLWSPIPSMSCDPWAGWLRAVFPVSCDDASAPPFLPSLPFPALPHLHTVLHAHLLHPHSHITGAATFLGFFNRTCAAPGEGAGPGMRPAGAKSTTWRTWRFVVVGKDARGREIVKISTVNGTPSPARCEGNMRPSTTACANTKVGIGSGASASDTWIVEPVDGRVDGAFYLVAAVSVA